MLLADHSLDQRLDRERRESRRGWRRLRGWRIRWRGRGARPFSID
jgi:hypothetical protein